MPCNFCQGNEDEEVEVCSDCLKFLTSLKCSECKNRVSFKKFNVICDQCISKGQKPIGKNIIENNLLDYIPIYDDKKFIDFYDIIIKINSIRDILKGWKIEFSKKGKDDYDKMKVRSFLKIGAIGDGNKGKTFLLQKLADIELPTGYSIKTEGLSIRCPDIDSENQNIILLDSKGSEYPLLEDSNFQFKNYVGNPKELKKQLDDLANDKRLTENFLRQIIIKESNMILVVVGNLTYQEQKLINEIKEESNNRNQSIYIIHNLQTFVEKSQVENYIEETLMKSATFRLVKNKEIRLRRKEENEDLTENDKYFIEKSFSGNHKDVCHLIMAKENSLAGNYYNNFVIRFLKNQMNNFPQQTSFPIIKKIKDYFFDMSRCYLGSYLTYDSFEETEDIIQVKKGKEIKLNKNIHDEMGFSNFIGKSYNPRYCYFIHNNRFYLQIEWPGKFDKKQFKYNIFDKDNYYIIDINSSKFIGTKDFFPKEKDGRNFFNNREEGPFHLRFNILAEDFQFKEKRIKMVKMGKKLKEEKKEDVKEEEKMINLLKASKEQEKEDIMPEEGVLTFYIELQEESQEEHPLSSSDEDDH